MAAWITSTLQHLIRMGKPGRSQILVQDLNNGSEADPCDHQVPADWSTKGPEVRFPGRDIGKVHDLLLAVGCHLGHVEVGRVAEYLVSLREGPGAVRVREDKLLPIIPGRSFSSPGLGRRCDPRRPLRGSFFDHRWRGWLLSLRWPGRWDGFSPRRPWGCHCCCPFDWAPR